MSVKKRAENKSSRKEALKKHINDCHNARMKISLIEGYKEMSRINLSLADSALSADNEALALCEQKLAECE